MSREFGDFQTPPSLVGEVIECLTRTGRRWSRVLEPTCGQGNFIQGILNSGMALQEVQGIEIQEEYVRRARSIIDSDGKTVVVIRESSIFDIDLRVDLLWRGEGSLLVIGNPPWITNSELSTLQSKNVPNKVNFKGLSGFEAMTGGSNFDISEYILLKLIHELAHERPTIALLCKTLVARNVLKFASDTKLPISRASIRRIDSKEHFGASVDACLFCIDVDSENLKYQVDVYQDLYSTEPISTMGIVNGQLVSDLDTNRDLAFIDGKSPLNWRQGLKHDAASVVELVYDKFGILHNKLGEVVKVEYTYVYPFLKSSDLGGKEKDRSKKAVIVTQRSIGEDTSRLENEAPNLWAYLNAHRSVFEQRKSSIYTNQPPFSMFGIGNYSFSLYKVAISGLYKSLRFSAIGPVNGLPVIFDDTCYFIACESAQQAALVAALLNNPFCLNFIHSIIFWDAKRPVTKRLLQRISLSALLDCIDKEALLLQANAQLKRMEIPSNEYAVNWPDNLSDLLQSSPINIECTPERKRLVNTEIFQMNLLEI